MLPDWLIVSFTLRQNWGLLEDFGSFYVPLFPHVRIFKNCFCLLGWAQ